MLTIIYIYIFNWLQKMAKNKLENYVMPNIYTRKHASGDIAYSYRFCFEGRHYEKTVGFKSEKCNAQKALIAKNIHYQQLKSISENSSKTKQQKITVLTNIKESVAKRIDTENMLFYNKVQVALIAQKQVLTTKEIAFRKALSYILDNFVLKNRYTWLTKQELKDFVKIKKQDLTTGNIFYTGVSFHLWKRFLSQSKQLEDMDYIFPREVLSLVNIALPLKAEIVNQELAKTSRICASLVEIGSQQLELPAIQLESIDRFQQKQLLVLNEKQREEAGKNKPLVGIINYLGCPA